MGPRLRSAHSAPSPEIGNLERALRRRFWKMAEDGREHSIMTSPLLGTILMYSHDGHERKIHGRRRDGNLVLFRHKYNEH